MNNRNEHLKHTDELLDRFMIEMKKDARRLYDSGGIDPASYSPKQYLFAQVLVAAVVRRQAGNMSLPGNDLSRMEMNRDIKNLEKM